MDYLDFADSHDSFFTGPTDGNVYDMQNLPFYRAYLYTEKRYGYKVKQTVQSNVLEKELRELGDYSYAVQESRCRVSESFRFSDLRA